VAVFLTQPQVLRHRQRGEDVPALGHVAQARLGDLEGFFCPASAGRAKAANPASPPSPGRLPPTARCRVTTFLARTVIFASLRALRRAQDRLKRGSHAFGSHGLLHCVRNDGGVHGKKRSDAAIRVRFRPDTAGS
jgi:hypothetical protein